MFTRTQVLTRHERGLAISAILLAVVLLAAIAITIAMSSRSTNSNAGQQQAKLNATTLINQANALKLGFDRMQANGIALSTITFDNTSGTGLWDPVSGGTVKQFLPAAAMGNTSSPTYPNWLYNNKIKLNGVGTTAGNDTVVLAADVGLTTCQAINNLLYNDSLTATPATASSATAVMANFVAGTTTGTAGTAIDMSTDTGFLNRPEGCFAETGGKYIYLKTVNET